MVMSLRLLLLFCFLWPGDDHTAATLLTQRLLYTATYPIPEEAASGQPARHLPLALLPLRGS